MKTLLMSFMIVFSATSFAGACDVSLNYKSTYLAPTLSQVITEGLAKNNYVVQTGSEAAYELSIEDTSAEGSFTDLRIILALKSSDGTALGEAYGDSSAILGAIFNPATVYEKTAKKATKKAVAALLKVIPNCQ